MKLKFFLLLFMFFFFFFLLQFFFFLNFFSFFFDVVSSKQLDPQSAQCSRQMCHRPDQPLSLANANQLLAYFSSSEIVKCKVLLDWSLTLTIKQRSSKFFLLTGQQRCETTYQQTLLTFPVLTVLNVLLIQKFYLDTLKCIFSSLHRLFYHYY